MGDPTLIIDAEPDWTSGIEISYGFQTAVAITPRFVEQRRPLYLSVTRSISCSYQFRGEEGQSLLNKLIYGKTLLLCVPIYSEPIFASAISAGGLSITTTTDLTYLWNIQNCSYAVILNFVTGASEMVKVSAASGTTITLSAAIVSTFTAAESVIYPAFAGMIKAFSRRDVTDLVAVIDCEFEEIFPQADEYTGDSSTWTDPQTCVDDLFEVQPAPPRIVLGRTAGITLDTDGVPSGEPENEEGYDGLNCNFYYYGVAYEHTPVVAAGTVVSGYAYCSLWTAGRTTRLFIQFNGNCYHSDPVDPYVAGKGSGDFTWIKFPFSSGPVFSQSDVGSNLKFGIEIIDGGANGYMRLVGASEDPGWLFDYQESGDGCDADGESWLGGHAYLGLTFINR